MSRRIEIELTSARDDATFTWRAAGARQPKGEVAATTLPEGASVGDTFRVEIESGLDGHEILGVIAERAPRKEPERLELITPTTPSSPSGSLPAPKVGAVPSVRVAVGMATGVMGTVRVPLTVTASRAEAAVTAMPTAAVTARQETASAPVPASPRAVGRAIRRGPVLPRSGHPRRHVSGPVATTATPIWKRLPTSSGPSPKS